MLERNKIILLVTLGFVYYIFYGALCWALLKLPGVLIGSCFAVIGVILGVFTYNATHK